MVEVVAAAVALGVAKATWAPETNCQKGSLEASSIKAVAALAAFPCPARPLVDTADNLILVVDPETLAGVAVNPLAVMAVPAAVAAGNPWALAVPPLPAALAIT